MKSKYDGETFRIFWYQYVKYRAWFYWNFIALFCSIVFRNYYGMTWPDNAFKISSQIWLGSRHRDFYVMDWSL